MSSMLHPYLLMGNGKTLLKHKFICKLVQTCCPIIADLYHQVKVSYSRSFRKDMFRPEFRSNSISLAFNIYVLVNFYVVYINVVNFAHCFLFIEK